MRLLKLISLTAAVVVSLAAAGARADPVVQVNKPRWLHQPHQKDIATAYPRAAEKARTPGAAAIRCAVAADGRLSQCSVLDETPQDLGFGAAALKLVREFQMQSDETGAVRPGAAITMEVDFDEDDPDGPPVLGVWPGDAAWLARPLPASTYAGGAPCPLQADPAKRCEVRFFRWQDRPSRQVMADILSAADQNDGHSELDCAAGQGGVLTDCQVAGAATPAASAALLRLAGQFRTAGKAYDDTPISAGRVIMDIDWAMMRRLTAPIG